MTQAYPLVWPAGWPRTDDWRRKNGYQFKTTFDIARRDLQKKLQMLGASDVVISSWLALRNDGNPYADQARRKIPDPGVAVYFTLRGKEMVIARDAYHSVHENLRSIGLAVEHLRGLERHGGGTMMERAFAGFTAIADRPHWTTVLGVSSSATRSEINAAFRSLAEENHPDRGGDAARMAEITEARDRALKEMA